MPTATKRAVSAQERKFDALSSKFLRMVEKLDAIAFVPESTLTEFDDVVPSLWVNNDGDFDERGQLLSGQVLDEAKGFLRLIERDQTQIARVGDLLAAMSEILDDRQSSLRNLIAKMRAYEGGISDES